MLLQLSKHIYVYIKKDVVNIVRILSFARMLFVIVVDWQVNLRDEKRSSSNLVSFS